METNIKNILKSVSPLIISLVITAVILTFSLIYKIYNYPLWFQEGGIIESASALGYFACALLMLLKGGWKYIKKYNYLFMLVIIFGLRELDFDKRFTTMGILKGKFYFAGNVPWFQKVIGLLVILLLVYIVVSIIKNHAKGFVSKIKDISPVHIGGLVVFIFLLFTKGIDGLSRKLKGFNISIDNQTSLSFEVVEEVLELGIPLLIISTFIIYCCNCDKSLSHDKHSLSPADK